MRKLHGTMEELRTSELESIRGGACEDAQVAAAGMAASVSATATPFAGVIAGVATGIYVGYGEEDCYLL